MMTTNEIGAIIYVIVILSGLLYIAIGLSIQAQESKKQHLEACERHRKTKELLQKMMEKYERKM